MHRHRQRKTDTPFFFKGKERERAGLQKKLFFKKKKIVHFLNFKTFCLIIISMRCNAFLSNSVAVSFSTKFISIGISNPTPIPLFVLVAITLQLVYNPGKRRNLFNVLLRKRGNNFFSFKMINTNYSYSVRHIHC